MLFFKQVRLSPQQKVKKRLSRGVCSSAFSAFNFKLSRSLLPSPFLYVTPLARTGVLKTPSPRLRSPSLHLLGSISILILLLLLNTSASDLLSPTTTVGRNCKRRRIVLFIFAPVLGFPKKEGKITKKFDPCCFLGGELSSGNLVRTGCSGSGKQQKKQLTSKKKIKRRK